MESDLLNNRYRPLELVGSGGMAAVYLSIDTLLQRQVAIKLLREEFASDPAFLARFQREAQAAAKLDHPNIVTVHDVGQDSNRHYIVMEYVDGQDLKTLVRQKGHLSIHQALDIAIQICAGVGHAHKTGIIHCDVKPQNVLLTRDGRVKVTDFGIARALSESGITESDTVWGSPLYFSPEQAAGEPPTPASDVYSIGVVIYEMLAGLPPFQAEKPTALALMHMREEPPPLAVRNPQTPPQLEWIIRKILAKEPAARYRTAGQLAHVLEEYSRHSEQMTGWQPAVPNAPSAPSIIYDPEPSGEAKKIQTAQANRWAWMLGAIALIAVTGLVPLWISVYQKYSAPPSMPPIPTSTPLVTITSETQQEQVSVPSVLGKSIEEARDALEQDGLRLGSTEERYEQGVEKGVVLEQTPVAGESVPFNSEVSVVVSGPGRELTMPTLLNYPVEIVQNGLESDGLQVEIEEVWSPKPEGMVLEQIPKPETTIHAGDTVTLTISGGVDIPIPLEVNLANLFTLESGEIPQDTFQPGKAINLTLYWRGSRAVSTHYVVFVHLLTPDGRLAAQQDTEPTPPTSDWTPGSEIKGQHQVDIPADQPPGLYELRVGMYPQGDPSYRLPVVDEGQTTAEENSILIAEIEVKP